MKKREKDQKSINCFERKMGGAQRMLSKDTLLKMFQNTRNNCIFQIRDSLLKAAIYFHHV